MTTTWFDLDTHPRPTHPGPSGPTQPPRPRNQAGAQALTTPRLPDIPEDSTPRCLTLTLPQVVPHEQAPPPPIPGVPTRSGADQPTHIPAGSAHRQAAAGRQGQTSRPFVSAHASATAVLSTVSGTPGLGGPQQPAGQFVAQQPGSWWWSETATRVEADHTGWLLPLLAAHAARAGAVRAYAPYVALVLIGLLMVALGVTP